MEDNNVPIKNTYNNALALTELVKMMRRQERLTISFVIDRFGYEAIEIESRRIEKFSLQISNNIYTWLHDYLVCGTMSDPIPSSTENLFIATEKNSNDYAEEILRRMIVFGEELPYMHIVPEIVDKPDKLTVTIKFPYGIFVFKIIRSENIMNCLASKGF